MEMTDNNDMVEMFIIPNSCSIVDIKTDDSLSQHWRKRINRQYKTLNLRYNGELIQMVNGDLPIEIWTTGMGSENWQDHGIPDSISIPEAGISPEYFPGYLPLRVVKDLKEGDVLELTWFNGETLRITASQLPYRYRDLGRFEDALRHVA